MASSDDETASGVAMDSEEDSPAASPETRGRGKRARSPDSQEEGDPPAKRAAPSPAVTVTPKMEQDMHKACERANFRKVLELLGAGVSVETCDETGWTAFGRAASAGHAELCRILLENGVDANLKGKRGVTALHVAARNGHARVAKVLLKFGADPDVEDIFGRSPRMDAKDVETKKVLDNPGPDPEQDPAKPEPKFDIGERVICEQTGALYDAKVQNRFFGEQTWFYEVHFIGWNAKHDLKLSEDAVLQVNEDNLQLQAEQKAMHVLQKKKARKEKGSKEKVVKEKPSKKDKKEARLSTAAAAAAVTAAATNVVESEIAVLSLPDVSAFAMQGHDIKVTQALVDLLLGDMQRIVVDNQVGGLETFVSLLVPHIFLNCCPLGHKESKTTGFSDDDVDGLLTVFDRAIGSRLLYRFERAQYCRLCEQMPAKRPCELYGAQHLLRFFVKMPELVMACNMPKETSSKVLTLANKLTAYLNKNAKGFFGQTYTPPPVGYQDLLNA